MDKPPVIYFDQENADAAFKVLRVLDGIERENPEFADMGYWQWLRQRARDRFAESFKGDIA